MRRASRRSIAARRCRPHFFLDRLSAEADLAWTFLSPSALMAPGERTGTFRLGGEELVTDAAGNGSISYKDNAVALIDEPECSVHIRRRFTFDC